MAKLRHVTAKAAPNEINTIPRIRIARDGAVAMTKKPRAEMKLPPCEILRSFNLPGRWRYRVLKAERAGMRSRKFANVTRPRMEIRRLDLRVVSIKRRR